MPHHRSDDEHQSGSSNRRNHHSDADHLSNDCGRERNNRSHWNQHRSDDYCSSWRQTESPVVLGDPETTIPLYTEEPLDLLTMRNSTMKNIMKQTFCFVIIPSYVTMSARNER